MAKKQQIILTHGSGMPSENVLKELKLGEILVQHASDPKEAALHTVRTEGNAESLVSFPSKEFVEAQIKEAITGTTGVNAAIATLQQQVDNFYNTYTAETADIRADFAAEDTAIRGEFAAADTALKSELNAEISKKANSTDLTTLAGRVTDIENDKTIVKTISYKNASGTTVTKSAENNNIDLSDLVIDGGTY